MIKKIMFLSMAFFAAAITLCGKEFNPSELPRQIRAMYGNYNISCDDVTEFKDLFASMQKAGFNVCDLKINAMEKLSVPEIEKKLRKLADEINKHQMVFTVYTYPIPQKSWTSVDFLDYQSWRGLMKNAFILAEASKKIPITAVKIDLEDLVLHHFKIPYNDKTWSAFTHINKINADVPLDKRCEFLLNHKMDKQYNKWIEQQLCNIAVKLRKEIHAINPKLHLGMMPAYDEVVYRAFIKKLSTPSVPAIIDNWSLYAGYGYSKEVVDVVALTKKLNPDNLAVSWFRINTYLPSSAFSSHVYHGACAGDGYSAWELTMLAQAGSKQKSNSKLYRLPAGQTLEKYWGAYAKANQALIKDIEEKTTAKGKRLPLKQIAADLKVDDVEIPNLIPIGDGSGKAAMLVMRERQIIYFYGEAGEKIKFEISHRAGQRRPVSLQYKVLDNNKKILKNGVVPASTRTSFSISLPKTGIGVMAITGGNNGMAWYGVKINSKHIGIATAPQRAYLFEIPFTVYAGPVDNKIIVKTGRKQSAFVKVNNKPDVLIRTEKPLILQKTKEISKIRINRSKLKGTYSQDIYITSDLKNPVFLSDGPERLLKYKN